MRLLTLNWNKNLIYVAVYWALEITFRLVNKLNNEDFKFVKEDDVQNEYVLVIFSNVADLLGGFLFLYIWYSSKSQKIKEVEEKKEDKI